MNNLIFIFLGGGAGALSRFALSTAANYLARERFPLGTLTVNILGSFIMGFCFHLFKHTGPRELKLCVLVGFLGAFTTFSSYSIETLNLFRDNKILPGLLNILANNALCLAAVALGLGSGMKLIKG